MRFTGLEASLINQSSFFTEDFSFSVAFVFLPKPLVDDTSVFAIFFSFTGFEVFGKGPLIKNLTGTEIERSLTVSFFVFVVSFVKHSAVFTKFLSLTTRFTLDKETSENESLLGIVKFSLTFTEVFFPGTFIKFESVFVVLNPLTFPEVGKELSFKDQLSTHRKQFPLSLSLAFYEISVINFCPIVTKFLPSALWLSLVEVSFEDNGFIRSVDASYTMALIFEK